MKKLSKLTLILIALMVAVLAFPAPAFAQTEPNDKVVVGGNFVLKSGESINGNLVILGGSGTLEKDTTVYGDIALTGGTLTVNGEVTGNITAMGGSINLGSTAIVHGDVSGLGYSLSRSKDAVVKGEVVNEEPRTGNLPFLNRAWLPDFNLDLHPVTDVLWGMFNALTLAALAAVVALLLPRPTDRVASAVITQPVLSGGLGLLTLLVAPALFILLVITIILSPLGLIGILVLGIGLVFGWIALGLEIGRREATLFKAEWAAPVAAGVGTLTLSLISAMVGLIPCIGWVAPVMAAIVGLGGVVLSQFGTQNPLTPSKPTPVVPAAPLYPPSAPYRAPEAPQAPFATPMEPPVPPEEKPAQNS